MTTNNGNQPPPKSWPKILHKQTTPFPEARTTPRVENPIARGYEWSMSQLEQFDKALAVHANRLGLKTFPIQYEIISSDRMIDLVSTIGMPVHYPHWSFGKQLVRQEHTYKKGLSGLAYEIVINTDPSLVYLMENNTLALQVLVMAHAGYGHNAFFKNNYLFRQFTHPDAILDYLTFARNYILDCEKRYGENTVSYMLDCAHTLSQYGVDLYTRADHSPKRKARQAKERQEFADRHYNPDHAMIDEMRKTSAHEIDQKEAVEPQENLLYFFEKSAPRLESWQREILRIVRKVSQYFYPQRLTKVSNEGAATFWHYTLLHELYDAGQVDDGFMLEWISNHSDVITQLPFDHEHYSGLNPYALGFSIYRDIRRVCENPTDEDREWFPYIAGTRWNEAIFSAMENFADDGLIEQFLSPKVMRDMRLFTLNVSEEDTDHYRVSAIHNEHGYRDVRNSLAAQYRRLAHTPDLVVVPNGDRDERALQLQHIVNNGRMLDQGSAEKVIPYIKYLWHYDVVIEEIESGSGNRLKIHRSK